MRAHVYYYYVHAISSRILSQLTYGRCPRLQADRFKVWELSTFSNILSISDEGVVDVKFTQGFLVVTTSGPRVVDALLDTSTALRVPVPEACMPSSDAPSRNRPAGGGGHAAAAAAEEEAAAAAEERRRVIVRANQLFAQAEEAIRTSVMGAAAAAAAAAAAVHSVEQRIGGDWWRAHSHAEPPSVQLLATSASTSAAHSELRSLSPTLASAPPESVGAAAAAAAAAAERVALLDAGATAANHGSLIMVRLFNLRHEGSSSGVDPEASACRTLLLAIIPGQTIQLLEVFGGQLLIKQAQCHLRVVNIATGAQRVMDESGFPTPYAQGESSSACC